MRTWRDIMPDYEIMCWNTSNFDITSNIFVAEAFGAKKWAFAADYIRLHALNDFGGIYLDTDVIVKKRFDDFLQRDFFTSMEYHHSYAIKHNANALINEDGSSKYPNTPMPGIGIQAAVLGSVRGHPFLRDCLNWYHDRHFILNDGRVSDQVILPSILAMIAEGYGLLYLDKLQTLKEGMLILPSEIFAGHRTEATNNSYAIHCCFGSWRERPKRRGLNVFLQRLRGYILLD
jgi:hypothetical protein